MSMGDTARCGQRDVGDVCALSPGHDGDHAGGMYSWPRTARCGAPSPDWAMSCARPAHDDDDDGFHENGDVIWTDDQAPVGRMYDNRTAFWAGWTRELVIWVAATVAGLVLFPGLHHEVARDVTELATIFAGLQLVRLAWMALRFWWEYRSVSNGEDMDR
jgi:hypothetical protein